MFHRYLQGQLTEEQKRSFRRELDADPCLRLQFETYCGLQADDDEVEISREAVSQFEEMWRDRGAATRREITPPTALVRAAAERAYNRWDESREAEDRGGIAALRKGPSDGVLLAWWRKLLARFGFRPGRSASPADVAEPKLRCILTAVAPEAARPLGTKVVMASIDRGGSAQFLLETPGLTRVAVQLPAAAWPSYLAALEALAAPARAHFPAPERPSGRGMIEGIVEINVAFP